ncbi:MAG: diacylglycerol kinase family protein [Phycisphaerales bacterium]
MRVVVLSNPRSGRGRAQLLGDRIADTLVARGHVAKRLVIGAHEELDAVRLASADALVVVGGDGTVHHAADAAIAADTPIYHAACGNENLFAREFAMSADPERIVRAVEDARTTRVDLARCNTQSFLIMCSLGPDAGIIRRLDKSRTKATGHLAYLEPVIDETFHPSIPRLSVEVDGEKIVDARRGMLVVANSRQYALRIDPAPRARIDDGLLDVVFLPHATALAAAGWMLAARLRFHLRVRGALHATGRGVRVTGDGGELVHQLDGELGAFGEGEDGRAEALELSVQPGVLPVLLA